MTRNGPPSPNQLLAVGLISLTAGFAFSAMDGFTNGFVRQDTLVVGAFAVVSGTVLWICKRAGFEQIGNNIVRLIFLVTACCFVYIAYGIFHSQFPLFLRILLALVLAALLYPIWLVTWFATLRSPAVEGEWRTTSPEPKDPDTTQTKKP